MRNKIILGFFLLALASTCYGFINLKSLFFSQVNDYPQCEIPCQSQMNKVLPGTILGANFISSGFNFENWNQKDIIELCCSKQKTYDFLNGLIVPDFISVEKVNLPDQEQINANITLVTQTQEQTKKYEINIEHTFLRRGLVLSADLSQFSVNMTTVLTFESEPNKCDTKSFDYDWNSLINYLGSKVFSEVTIGAYQKVSVQLFTDKNYSRDQAIQIYKNHISKQSLETIAESFKNSDLNSIGTQIAGGVSLINCSNWSDYLSKIGPQNYVFSKNSESQFIQLNYTSIDSYHLFDSQSHDIQECAEEIWEYRQRFIHE